MVRSGPESFESGLFSNAAAQRLEMRTGCGIASLSGFEIAAGKDLTLKPLRPVAGLAPSRAKVKLCNGLCKVMRSVYLAGKLYD